MPGVVGDQDLRVADLEVRFHAFRVQVLKWQLEHTRYHTCNETRWGLLALMRAHPFRTLTAGMLLGAGLAAGCGLERWWELVAKWVP